MGNKPFRAAPSAGIARSARPRPSNPPISAIVRDSASTKKEDPTVLEPDGLQHGEFAVRSRTEIAMVLPVTSSSVKNTTLPMAMIRNSMLPNCFTQLAAKADSVSVFVS